MANKLFTVRRSERNAPPGPTKAAPAAHTTPPVQLSARAARRAAERDARRTARPATPEGTPSA
jgi:hypothetical protein